MKNRLTFVLVVGLLLTLTACGDKSPQPTVTTTTAAPTTTTTTAAETLDTSVITDPAIVTTTAPTTRFTKPTVIITTTTKTSRTHMQIPEYVSEKGALVMALEHAELTEEDVRDVEVEYDHHHGRQVWDVEFAYQHFEYEYTIDAATHKITSFVKNDVVHSTGIGGASATAPKFDGITREVARDAALKHAGVTEVAAWNLEVELDKDDGVWDVSFESGRFDYEYEIDAKTGAVLRFEKEPWD